MQTIKRWIKENFSGWLYRNKVDHLRKKEIEKWVAWCKAKAPAKLSDASFDIFTYHGEDGIIAYLLQQLKNVPEMFIDIGAGDCIKGNCANLAVHYGWKGVFIDRNEKSLKTGKKFYSSLEGKRQQKFNFIPAIVTPENVNTIVTAATGEAKIGLLSLDIDGNDYWVWKAIDIIKPSIVVIEAKVEFGLRSLAVPYGAFNHRSVDIKYNGASVEALRRLGMQKGYRLVGANKQGYNLFFIREEDAPADLPSVDTEAVLNDPGTIDAFYTDDFFVKKDFLFI